MHKNNRNITTHRSSIRVKSTFVACCLIVAFSFIFVSLIHADETVTLDKRGKDYDEAGTSGDLKKSGNYLRINGTWVEYHFGITEYRGRIKKIELGVEHKKADDGSCDQYGTDWPRVRVYGGGTWDNRWQILDNSTDSWDYKWDATSRISHYTYTSGGRDYFKVEINAPNCDGDNADLWVDYIKVRLTLSTDPELYVDKSSLNVGVLYFEMDTAKESEYKGSTAKKYNDLHPQEFTIKNTGDPKSTLQWSIVNSPELSVSQESGNLSQNQSTTVTAKLNPHWSGPYSYSGSIKVKAGSQEKTITVKAEGARPPDSPTLKSPALGSNSKVNIVKGQPFMIELNPPAKFYFPKTGGDSYKPSQDDIKNYQFQDVSGSNLASLDRWKVETSAAKQFIFSSTGDYTIYARVADKQNVAGFYLNIPVRVWNRPTVKAKPPKPEDVDWFDNTYAGIVGKPVKLQADAELNGNEKIDKYIWLDDAGSTLVKQNPGQIVTYQWDNSNPSGRIYCKALTNYGIESDKQHFNYKIYPTLEISHGGPYTGKPKKPVTLKASVLNANSYPGATFQYEWIVQKTKPNNKLDFVPMGKSADPTLETTWPKDGERIVKLSVTAITLEGLTLTGSAETKVKLEAGIPTAHPGGPYRGGIAGGNFSPVQFEGNRPDFVEDEDVGKIVKWEWGFGGPKGNALQFDGKDDYVALGRSDEFQVGKNLTLQAWIYPEKQGAYIGVVSNVWDSGATESGYCLTLDGSSGVYFALTPKDSGIIYLSSGRNTINLNRWHHIAGTYDGRTMRVYVNGVERAAKSVSGDIDYDPANNLYIGTYKDNDENILFKGRIDEVAIWNRVLTPVEIQTNAQGRTLSTIEPGLIGYWPLDEGSGTTAKDDTPSGNHGTLKNEPTWVTVDNVFLEGPGATVWNPTHAYPKAGEYTVNLRVRSEAGKWSPVKTTTVTVIDGKIEGNVKAADLRTPVKDVRLTLTSSHVDKAILANIGTRQSALQFDGVDDYVDVGTIDFARGDYTISAWFKNSSSNNQDILAATSGGNHGVLVEVQPDGRLRYLHRFPPGVSGGVDVYSSKSYNDGAWHHVAAVKNGDTNILYVDGSPVGNQSAPNKSTTPLDVVIGRLGKTKSDGYFKGSIDEVSVWNHALTQAEVEAKMQNRTLSGSESGLVGYWSFDEGRGTTAADNTLNGNHGAIYGNPKWFMFEISLSTDSNGNVYAMTNGKGFYSFEHLPLGEYRIIASKEEGGDFHEFDGEVKVTELTLTGPNQLGVDFVDISVFPISGRIVYSIQKQGKDVFVEDVVIKAQPVGSTSAVESLLSSKSPNATGTNYSLPLFAGKYLFKAVRGGHDIRIKESSPGYDKNTRLVTIKRAVTALDFIDNTTRTVAVYVEDSGGFPIDTYQSNKIKVQVNGDNGFVEEEVKSEGGRTYLQATVPPGKYTISLPNVPTAIVKDDKSKKQAEVDLTGEDSSVTMVVPVPIVLEISGVPKLLDALTDEQKAKLGLGEGDNPEGFMYYYPPAPQTFIYIITATANGNPVTDFTLFVTDDVSETTEDAATEKKFTTTVDNFEVDVDHKHIIKYTVLGGLPKASVVKEDDPNTYVIDPDTGKKVPKALLKPIKFRAEKDGYEKSITYPKEITVLGELPVGGAQKIVSIPNVNYMVLHDPPGDGSYAYLDDSLTIKGILRDMQLTIEDKEIPVYPSPWSVERRIKDADFGAIEKSSGKDLGQKGLLGYRDSDPALGHFAAHAVLEAATGAGIVALGPVGYAIQLVKTGAMAGAIAGTSKIQYEVSPSRHIETPSGDKLPDIMGPGKGDIYFGEGWTLGLQTKYRLGIKKVGDSWTPDTKAILTYDILDRTNQYVYTVRDIENIITDLTATIATITGDSQEEKDQKGKLDKAKGTWQTLLDKNLAYRWHRDYVLSTGTNHEKYKNDLKAAFEEFRRDNNLPEDKSGKMETLIFSAGPAYEYSRTIAESSVVYYTAEVFVGTDSEFNNELEVSVGAMVFGSGTKLKAQLGSTVAVSTDTYFGTEYKSGQESEQTVGFVLQDDDIGDNYTTRVYADPIWGAPLFFTDAGSITSDPWDYGTNKSVDMTMELLDRKLLFGVTSSVETFSNELDSKTLSDNLKQIFQQNGFPLSADATVSVELRESFWQIIDGNKVYIVKKEGNKLNVYQPQSSGTFDYRDGAHYKVKINYTGFRHLRGSGIAQDMPGGAGIGFTIFVHPYDNDTGLTTLFNGHEGGHQGRYRFELQKGYPTATIAVSIYPPPYDWSNSFEREYSAVLQVENEHDYQIVRKITVKPKFADLHAPRTTITAPYDGQRISPVLFKDEAPFNIEVFSDDSDVAKIQLQIRSKQTNGVWEPWRNLPGIVWEDGKENLNVTVLTHSDRNPVRRVFTFKWKGAEIANLGVGEYALRAVAQDKATRLTADGASQEPKPNVDLDAPVITFQVDGSKPTVLTTIPDYQAREGERIYRGELSALFNDDMRAGDFSDRTFYVTDLLNNNEKAAGFVSYSPALRKAIFVPVVPFQPNGFFRVEIKTDTIKEDGTLEKGIHDLAGNPLDNAFMFTFRTTDAPFEETWSITLAATDGTGIDANNIAAVAYSALDGEDEQDVRAVPKLSSQFGLSFLDRNQVKFDRDIRPADGRLSHHWFFTVSNPQNGSNVQIFWNPSIKLRRTTRQYQVIRLVEFDADGSVNSTITLEPQKAESAEILPIGGGALSLDGNDSMRVNHSGSLPNGTITMMGWIKPTSITGNVYLFNKIDDNPGYDGYALRGYLLFIDSNKIVRFTGGQDYGQNDDRQSKLITDIEIQTNQWSHIAWTFDPGTTALKIYVDGVLGYEKELGHPVEIGISYRNLDIGQGLNGLMDEVSAWNRVLTQAEIEGKMFESLVGDEDGLVGYWAFNEASGNIAPDGSPKGNNGTLNGNPTIVSPATTISGALAHTYIPAEGEAVRFFRLDVQKIGFVATNFSKGSSGWKFFSVPITPQRADPFVNLGDDIDPFKLYKYDTKLVGYKIYPLDIGEVGLQTGHGYFTRLEKDIEVDVGGASNLEAKILELVNAGWHSIGNPFTKPVNVADLTLKQGDVTKGFSDAVTAGWIEAKLYRWKVVKNGTDVYEAVSVNESQKQLVSWEGYWLKTKAAELTLTIPAPSGLDNYIPPLPPSFEPPMAPSVATQVVSALNSEITKGQFNLKLALKSDFASDLTTTLGTRNNAKVGFDSLDMSEPPTLEETVSAYFEHLDWEVESDLYNTDYQPTLKIGEQRNWELVVYTDKPKAKMKLSWEDAIDSVHEVTAERNEQIPSDIMLSFRQLERENPKPEEPVWQDMREVRFVDLDTKRFITKVTFEIRAERFEMAPLDTLKVIPGEKQVKLQWTVSDNPFITGYTITRRDGVAKLVSHNDTEQNTEQVLLLQTLEANASQFIDTDVEEETTYTYQVSIHFKTGAELKSDLFTVTVLPIIKQTRLLQSYPNPFNPDTWIPYELKKESHVTIEIYNVAGQLIRTLDIGTQPRGRYISREKSAYWNGRNEFGEHVASGVYFYMMRAGNFSATRKMVILK